MKKDVLRKARKDIHRAFNRRVTSRRGRFPELPSGPPAPAAPTTLKTSVELTYTYDLQDPDSDLLNASSPVLRSYNADKWLDATRARITARGGNLAEVDITTTPGSVYFNGEAVHDFLACGFDLVSLPHSVPKEHLARIRAKANKDIEIIHGFMNFESVSQSSPWNQYEHANRNFIVPSAIVSAPQHGYDCYSVDKYELYQRQGGDPYTWPVGTVACAPPDTANFSKHSWEIKLDTAGLCDVWSESMLDTTIQSAWIQGFITAGTWLSEGIIVDNILPAPYKGGATNDFPALYDTDAYLGVRGEQPGVSGGSGMKGMLGRLGSLAAADARGKFYIWGNCDETVDHYSDTDLSNRFLEHFFRKYDGGWQKRLLTELEAAIDVMVANDIRINVGGLTDQGDIDAWFTSTGPGGIYGSWPDLRSKVAAVGWRDKFFAQACRATTDGHLFWQPEFEEPA